MKHLKLLSVFVSFLFISVFSYGIEIQKRGIIIPAYFYDSSIWERLFNGKDENVDFLVIVNPASGPGDFQDPHYLDITQRLKNEGMVGIGYVHTSWGSRDINVVKEEIDRWLSFYPDIKGFFLDEASTEEADIPYYEELYQYIKGKGNYTVVLNPGTKPAISYYSISDYIVSYESPYEDFSSCQADIPEKSGCIVYNVPEYKLKEIIQNENVKFIYITDDRGANPYDTLPSYYEEEISLLASPVSGSETYPEALIIPSYFYDGNLWERVLNLDTNEIKIITIINPASGAGERPDPHYREIIRRLNEKGITPIGYIYTEYGKRPLRIVKREIRKYLKFYPGIKGFFIDQTSTERRKLRYYRKIYRYIKRKGNFLVILSPGAPTHRGYYRFADYVITTVGNYPDCNEQKPEKDGCILYGIPYNQMIEVLHNENVKLIYITDDGDGNPFDNLPSYLEEEVELIKR